MSYLNNQTSLMRWVDQRYEEHGRVGLRPQIEKYNITQTEYGSRTPGSRGQLLANYAEYDEELDREIRRTAAIYKNQMKDDVLRAMSNANRNEKELKYQLRAHNNSHIQLKQQLNKKIMAENTDYHDKKDTIQGEYGLPESVVMHHQERGQDLRKLQILQKELENQNQTVNYFKEILGDLIDKRQADITSVPDDTFAAAKKAYEKEMSRIYAIEDQIESVKKAMAETEQKYKIPAEQIKNKAIGELAAVNSEIEETKKLIANATQSKLDNSDENQRMIYMEKQKKFLEKQKKFSDAIETELTSRTNDEELAKKALRPTQESDNSKNNFRLPKTTLTQHFQAGMFAMKRKLSHNAITRIVLG